ncbi:MAG: DUF433 domain-containing protein [Chloroflexota bacterium]
MDSPAAFTEFISRPLYSYAEADHLAGVTRGTARRWLAGYDYRAANGSAAHQPPVSPRTEESEAVSFVDLVEVVAIGGLKREGFSLKAIRQIVSNCQEIFQIERPLITLRFKVGGREVFVQSETALVEVGRRKREQAWDEILGPFLESLDYRFDLVSRWWPRGREANVVIDPEYSFGLPVIEGSGVRTEIIVERFKAGDSCQEIAKDFSLTATDVERALQFEVALAA